jgi:hypothetical protein
LLVAAAQPPDLLIDAGGGDMQVAHTPFGDGALAGWRDESCAADFAQNGRLDVEGNAHVEEQPGGLAVFRQIADPVADRVAGRPDHEWLAIQYNLACRPVLGGEHRPHQFAATGAEQARKPKDFTFAQREIDGDR